MRTSLVTLVGLATLLAGISTARAGQLENDLREAHFARVGIAGRTYVLVKPRPVTDGLGYDRVEGYAPQARQAIFVGADADSAAPFANPVPWSSIDRLESGVKTRRPGAMWGGFLGLATGVVLGTLVRVGSSESGEDPGAGFVVGTAAVTTMIGAGIGALFPVRHWHDVPLMEDAR